LVFVNLLIRNAYQLSAIKMIR